ncbi:MAG: LptF/LptG family permease [Verrucomicrobiota bacterium]
MRIVDRYIGTQILISTLFAVGVLSFVIVLGNLFQELFPRMAEGTVSVGDAFQFIGLVLPYSLIFTIPWGFLTAVLLVFGRLSADKELISFRMAGMSLPRICLPVLVLGLVFSGICFWVNVSIGPRSEQAISFLIFRAATEKPESLFVEDRVFSELDDKRIYIGRREGRTLYDFHLVEVDELRRATLYVQAEKVTLNSLPSESAMEMRLENAYIEAIEGGDFREKAPLRVREHFYRVDLSGLKSSRFKTGQLDNAALREALRSGDLDQGQRQEVFSELSLRYSLSLACMTFGLVAIPLGIRTQRRETSTGFVLSVVIAVVYFLFIVFAKTKRAEEGWLPHGLVWLPNALFLGLGIWLFLRVARR